MKVAPFRPGSIPGGGAATCDALRRDRALAEPKRSGGRRRAEAQRRTAKSRCADELGIARSDDAGVEPGELQHLLAVPGLASVAAIYIAEDSLDPLEVPLQSGALQRGQTLLFE